MSRLFESIREMSVGTTGILFIYFEYKLFPWTLFGIHEKGTDFLKKSLLFMEIVTTKKRRVTLLYCTISVQIWSYTEAIVIKKFNPNACAWEGAEQLLIVDFTALSLVLKFSSNPMFRSSIKCMPNLLHLQRGLLFCWAGAHKISSC